MNNIVSKIKKIDYKEGQIRQRENTNLHLDWLWWVIETSRGRRAFIFQTWFHTNPNWLHIKYYVYMLKTDIIVRTTLSCLQQTVHESKHWYPSIELGKTPWWNRWKLVQTCLSSHIIIVTMWQILIHDDTNWTIHDRKTRTKLGKQNLSNKNKVHMPRRFNNIYKKESKRQFSRSWNSLMECLKERERER